MEQSMVARLVEFSALSEQERDAALSVVQAREVREYLEALKRLDRLQVPQPSAARKWAGRAQLLDAVAAYDQRSFSRRFSLGRLTAWKGGAATFAMAALVMASIAGAASLPGVSGAGGRFSEVLAALGLRSVDKVETPRAPVIRPHEQPWSNPELDIPVAAPVVSEDSLAEPEVAEPPVASEEAADEPGALPPGQVLDTPGPDSENPGLGVDPPGQGGENQGQGVDPPGHGGENPGQGVEPPGHGGENPGQGVEPPGHGGENPGQGSGSGSNNQGGTNPEQGSGSSSGGQGGSSGQAQDGGNPGRGGANGNGKPE